MLMLTNGGNMPQNNHARNIYLLRVAMYSSNNRRTHLGPPSSSHASRWAWVSGRHDTGAGRAGAGGRPAPSRLPPFMPEAMFRISQ